MPLAGAVRKLGGCQPAKTAVRTHGVIVRPPCLDDPSRRSQRAWIEPSVGSVGDSYDNALAETINGLCKAEVIHRRGPWRSFEAVEYATLEWVDWFNHRGLLHPIGNIPPAEPEDQIYAAAGNIDMAA
jgi:putative transposase